MSIAVRGYNSSGPSGTVSTITLTNPGSAGDLLIACIASYEVGIDTLSGWTLVGQDSNGDYQTNCQYRVMQAGDGNPQFTLADYASYAAGILVALSGVDTSNPIDTTSTEYYRTSDTSMRLGNITVANAPVWSVGIGAFEYGSRTCTPPSGYSEDIEQTPLGDWTISLYMCHKAIAANGAIADQNATISIATTVKHLFHLAVREAGGGGISLPLLNHLLLGD